MLRSIARLASNLQRCTTLMKRPLINSALLRTSSSQLQTRTDYSDKADDDKVAKANEELRKEMPFFFTLTSTMKNMHISDMRGTHGFDLNCAAWLVKNGAKVRFAGHDEFVTSDKQLPLHENEKVRAEYILEEVDAGPDSTIMHRAVTFFEGCNGLKFMRFLNCSLVDDRMLEAMSEIVSLQENLEALEILCCWEVTGTGLMYLTELRNLKYLKIVDVKEVQDLPILMRFLREALPDCEFDFQQIG